MKPESAEVLAIDALAWLATNDELLPIFMGSTGAAVEDLRSRADDPAFLASILDFLMMDDAWVVAYCDARGRGYTDPMAARAALPGGAQVNWT